MTTAGTDEHPDVEEIAALAEGLLSPERGAEVQGHLGRCPLCADVRDSLAEVRSLLGTLPGPTRMPDDVAARIDAALAAEALLRAGEPHAAQDAGHPVPPVKPGPGLTSAPSAAAARPVGAPTSGAHVSRETSTTPSRPGAHPGGSSGPGRPSRSSRRRWRALTAVAGAAALGVGGVIVYGLGDHDGGRPTAAGRPSTAVGSFSGVALPAKVHELLGSATPQARPNAATGGENSPFSTKPPTVPACVLKATGHADATPVATARGDYEGRSSYLVVLPDPASPRARVDAFVVDAACATAGAAGERSGTVLTHQTYDRH